MYSAVDKLLGKDFSACLFPGLEVKVVAYLLITFFGGEDFQLREELTERKSSASVPTIFSGEIF